MTGRILDGLGKEDAIIDTTHLAVNAPLQKRQKRCYATFHG
jgi:hypothetical protein